MFEYKLVRVARHPAWRRQKPRGPVGFRCPACSPLAASPPSVEVDGSIITERGRGDGAGVRSRSARGGQVARRPARKQAKKLADFRSLAGSGPRCHAQQQGADLDAADVRVANAFLNLFQVADDDPRRPVGNQISGARLGARCS